MDRGAIDSDRVLDNFQSRMCVVTTREFRQTIQDDQRTGPIKGI